MIVYRFPPQAQTERSAFSVVGTVCPAGTLGDELILIPPGALPPAEAVEAAGFYYLDASAPAHLPICPRTLVPEVLSDRLPENPVWISSRLSGGTLEARLLDAVSRYGARLWLVIQPFSDFFTLPCPSGSGIFLSGKAASVLHRLDTPAFSRSFCCACCRAEYCGQRGLFLFDTPESISEKLRLAYQCGAGHVLVFPAAKSI